MCKSGHTSVLEHSVIFVRTHSPEAYLKLLELLRSYEEEMGMPHYIRFSVFDDDTNEYKTEYGKCISKEHLFSGNIRAWRNLIDRYSGETILREAFYSNAAFNDLFFKRDIELFGEDRAKVICNQELFAERVYDIEEVDSIPTNPEEFKFADMHNIVTLRITGDRGVVDEYARHRQFGMSVESTRYCNYSGNGVTFCYPFWFDNVKSDPAYASLGGLFANICYDTESAYQSLISKIKIPQVARGALILWTKSEIVMTGTINMWKYLISLRDSAAAHPEARKIAKMIEQVLVNEARVNDYWGVKTND